MLCETGTSPLCFKMNLMMNIIVLWQILNHLVDSKRFTFEDRYASLTEKQKTVLMAIASEFPSQVTLTSQDFMTRYNLKTASSVQTAVKGLVEKGILSDNHGIRRPTDLLFMLWLKDF